MADFLLNTDKRKRRLSEGIGPGTSVGRTGLVRRIDIPRPTGPAGVVGETRGRDFASTVVAQNPVAGGFKLGGADAVGPRPLINRQIDTPALRPKPLSSTEQASDAPKSTVLGADGNQRQDFETFARANQGQVPGGRFTLKGDRILSRRGNNNERVLTSLASEPLEAAAGGNVARDEQGRSLGFVKGDRTGGVSFTGADGVTRTAAESTGNFSTERVGDQTFSFSRNAEDLQRTSDFRTAMANKRGGLARLEGKVISIGDSGGGGSLANFITSRNAAREKTRGAAALQERSDKFALVQQKSDLERQDKTFSLSPGEQQFDASGKVIARGGKKAPKEIDLLDDVAMQFAQRDEEGNVVLGLDDKPTIDAEAQSEFTRYLGKFGGGGDQRTSLADYLKASEIGVPENHLDALKKNPALADQFLEKYGYLPSFVGA